MASTMAVQLAGKDATAVNSSGYVRRASRTTAATVVVPLGSIGTIESKRATSSAVSEHSEKIEFISSVKVPALHYKH